MLRFFIMKYSVAPMRNMMILKFELQAAVYGARIRPLIMTKYFVMINRGLLWKDSSNFSTMVQ